MLDPNYPLNYCIIFIHLRATKICFGKERKKEKKIEEIQVFKNYGEDFRGSYNPVLFACPIYPQSLGAGCYSATRHKIRLWKNPY